MACSAGALVVPSPVGAWPMHAFHRAIAIPFALFISVDAALSLTTPQGGDVDFSFDPGPSINASVRDVAIQPDGRVLIGGDFQSVSGVARGHVARLNADGSLDTTFLKELSGANGPVNSLAAQTDGRVLIGGLLH